MRRLGMGTAFVLLGMLFMGVLSAQAIVAIDDFDTCTPQGAVDGVIDGVPNVSAMDNCPGAIGETRELLANKTESVLNPDSSALAMKAVVASGTFRCSTDAFIKGECLIRWDGNADGVQSFDLGADLSPFGAFLFTIVESDFPLEAEIILCSSAGVCSAPDTFTKPAVPPDSPLLFEHPFNFPGFDLSDVGSISLRLHIAPGSSGRIDLAMDLIELCSGRVGNFVWNDLNSNGIQDPGEPGINGVTVHLFGTDVHGIAVDRTRVTMAHPTLSQDGYYQFTGLCAGTYTVEIPTTPPDFTPTAANAPGSTTANDSNTNPTSVTLTDDDREDQTIDFGFVAICQGKIGDFVWHDLDRDGIQDAGEPGIANVTVKLLDSTNTTVLATTTTDAHGNYLFTQLCAGTYHVMVDDTTVSSDLEPTLIEQGSDTAVDSNDPSGVQVVLPTNNSMDLTIDFGYNTPCDGAIGDFVWLDLNQDGIQDPGEPGIAGVTVKLLDSTQTNVLATTVTDMDGLYLFPGLCKGIYYVMVDDMSPALAGLEPSPTDQGGNDTKDSEPNPVMVSLPEDDTTDLTIDFGYNSVCDGVIGDFVWMDTDRDGIQDAGEPGLVGVMVKLLDSTGTNVLATTVTGAGGLYLFPGLCAGTYQVMVDTMSPALEGLEPSPTDQGGNDTKDSDPNPVVIVLPANDTENLTIDFGYNPICEGVIGDFVWHDVDADGIRDPGEPGIPGVQVELRNPSNNALIAVAITDANGFYSFMGLCAGTYKVQVVTPAGFSPTIGGVGSDSEVDSNNTPALMLVTIPDDGVDLSIDFGFVTEGGEGCTPGFWKKSQHFASWPAPYTPNMPFSAVFEDAFPGKSLLQVLNLGGGGLNALGRHTVAALLNAASSNVDYGLTVNQVITMFNNVFPGGNYETLKNQFDALNNEGCPDMNNDHCDHHNNDHHSYSGYNRWSWWSRWRR